MPFDRKIPYRSTACAAVLVLLAAACSQGGGGGGGDFREADAKAAAQRWVSTEFTPSTLSKQQQLAEMDWFMKAAAPYRGMEINVVSETITTHEYESKQLAKAFTEITGIRLKHDLIQEGDVIEKLQTQIQGDQNIYDAYVNDSDLIGTHARGDYVVPLSDYIAGEGKAVTSPTLDLADFIGISFTTGPDKKIYQLPDQQFANLYWFRYDWFTDPDVKKQFKDAYGYELGVPVNWAAYEDIADFFTTKVNGNGTMDGKKVYGHMDYGRKDPSLGWRFTDSWLSMAGNGDPGLPNGLPVDDWGIRVENCRPVGSSVTRGGDTNGPASVYALTKYVDWLKRFAPKEAAGMNFSESGPVPAQGNIAQQIFWYTSFTADMTAQGLPVVNGDGTPKWRIAPSPHGAYWKDGNKLGYQDAGSWTLLKNTPKERRAAAWLYAQFVTSKTVSLKKSIAGLTFIRDSDIKSDYFEQNADKYGGLIEFYRGPAREQWTPTGTNVPDYPRLAQLWWQNVATAVTGETTPQQSMDNLAKQQDDILSRLERRGYGGACAPKLNPERDVQYWLDQPGAPAPKLADERGKPETLDYDRLIAQWKKAG
ncbi:ABC transporter substrate-binding protein [Nonomuraea glycinis]|uniref:ABC transporter substrate-binding protein n=1 Tax=Nonomuraea glycinis TaxID=2047744 RepID=A0A918E6R6_9ACTN|nr:ABC transporter substrate-binding protein [Nonomuraea glycinis]MCA2177287.1 ABC transporter substrate-binding protein [Nonomuraea glycinis]GGP08993.1 ABC transporter substrate-binding protein [Nonomuraea glycinis]